MKKNISIFFVLVLISTGHALSAATDFDTSTSISNINQAKIEIQSVVQRFDGRQIKPLPTHLTFDSQKVALGKRLFHEKKLSHDNTISCAFCHDLNRGGVDKLKTSIGINGAIGKMNSPTVFNSGFNFVQFWDGRAHSLEEQASGPILNPIEMGSNWDEIAIKLNATDYVQAFNKIYRDGITAGNIVDSIATYERSLITPSRFDGFLLGNEKSLTEEEKEGFKRFTRYGCSSCHQGINIGGNMFQKLGGVKKYFLNQQPSKQDLGRFNVTFKEEDKHVFKVPSLRNVAVTAPYFHNGSIATLEEAIVKMGSSQLGRELSAQDIRVLSAFLHSLTGQWEGKYLQ